MKTFESTNRRAFVEVALLLLFGNAAGAATLAGTVRDSESSAAIPAQVEVFDHRAVRRDLVQTPNGVFRIEGLPAGRYYLKMAAAGHIAESYPDIRCFVDECDVRFGQPFQLEANSVVEGLTANLAPWATLNLRAIDAATRLPLFPDLFVVDASSGQVLEPFHDHPYISEYFAMAPGTYYVVTKLPGYAYEGADGTHLASPRLEDASAAQPVLLLAGKTVDLQLELDRLGRLVGRTDAALCRVRAYAPGDDRVAAEATCDADGHYAIDPPPGPHQLLFSAMGRGSRFLGGKACALGAAAKPVCRRDQVPAAEVAPGGQLTLADVTLPAAGGIAGMVLAQPGIDEAARLRLYDQDGVLVAETMGDPTYTFENLNPGAYYLEAIGNPPAGRLIWPATSCEPNDCDPLAGTTIVVEPGEIRQAIDVSLPFGPVSPDSYCTAADPNALCLVDERFRVDVTWSTNNGNGIGRAVPLSADTGSFWFFSSDNVEMTVKVLDGCALNGHYWVFSAGLTNVGVELRVADTVTDRFKVYQSPLLQPFQPIQDTTAFTCWR